MRVGEGGLGVTGCAGFLGPESAIWPHPPLGRIWVEAHSRTWLIKGSWRSWELWTPLRPRRTAWADLKWLLVQWATGTVKKMSSSCPGVLSPALIMLLLLPPMLSLRSFHHRRPSWLDFHHLSLGWRNLHHNHSPNNGGFYHRRSLGSLLQEKQEDTKTCMGAFDLYLILDMWVDLQHDWYKLPFPCSPCRQDLGTFVSRVEKQAQLWWRPLNPFCAWNKLYPRFVPWTFWGKKKASSIGNHFYWPGSVIFRFLKQLEGLWFL